LALVAVSAYPSGAPPCKQRRTGRHLLVVIDGMHLFSSAATLGLRALERTGAFTP
jgi:hypothetical protein